MAANLQVGIDTTQAKAALLELRKQMENQPHNLLINVDPTSVDRDIQRYLKQRTFKISVDTSSMGREVYDVVGRALDSAFAKERKLAWNVAALNGGLNSAMGTAFGDSSRRLQFDRNRLVTDIKEAVGLGFAGGVIHPSVAPVAASRTASGALSADVVLGIQRVLTPAVDELSKAAAALGSAARSAGVTRSAGGAGSAVATESIRYSDPNTGVSRGVSQRLEDADKVKAAIVADRAAQKAAADTAWQQETNDMGTRASQRRSLRQAERNAELSEFGTYQAQRRAASNAEAREEQNQLGTRAAQFRALRNAAYRDEQNLDGQRSSQRRSLLNAERREEQNQLGQRQIARRAKLLAENNEEKNLLGQRANEVKSRLAEINSYYARAQEVASQQYTPKGAAISAARATEQQFGTQRTQEFLGPKKGFLLDANVDLAQYEKHLNNSSVAGKAWRDTQKSMNIIADEGHSAFRGLAGSVGAMWATYGSIIPIAAAFALGAAIKSVITNGKDLEYQLAFVSALTDQTAISMDRLNQATAGSMVGPIKAAEAMRGLAQNGLNASEAFQALPTILSLATAGEMTLSEAALGATGVMAAFNLTVSDLGRVSDVFAKAAAMSNTDVKGMVEAMKQASTVGDQYHVSIEETAASLAVMAKRNIDGTQAGTAFRNMMKEMSTPTKQAKEAMDALNLSFFNGGQLNPLVTNLDQLKEKLDGLNEKSRLAFLDRMYGERGGKAMNAILSDLDLFKSTLGTLQNDAKGFADSVADTLAQTTTGRIQKLVADIQTLTAGVFQANNSGINYFVETLRSAVNSPELMSSLNSLMKGFGSLTAFVIENASAIKTVIEVWLSFKAVGFAIDLVSSMTTGIRASILAFQENRAAAAASAAAITANGFVSGATVPVIRNLAIAETEAAFAGTAVATSSRLATPAVIGLGAAARGTLAAFTGGISLVIGLAAEFLILSRNTNEATEAEKANQVAIENGNREIQLRIGNLDTEIGRLVSRNRLMREGYTAEQAAKRIEAQNKVSPTTDVDNEENRISTKLKIAKEKRQSIIDQNYSNAGTEGGGVGLSTSAVDEDIKSLESALKTNSDRKALILSKSREEQVAFFSNEAERRRKIIEDFNKNIQYSVNHGLIKAADLRLPSVLTNIGLDDNFDKDVEEAKRKFDELKTNKELPKKPDGAARSMDKALLADQIAKIKELESAEKERAANKANLDKARYPASLYGSQMAAYLEEQRAIEETTNAIRIQTESIKKLIDYKNSLRNLKDPDRVRAQTAIDAETASLDRLIAKEENQRQVANAHARNATIIDNNNFNKELGGLRVGDEKGLQKEQNKYDYKIINPRDAEASRAALEVTNRYAQDIEKAIQASVALEAQLVIEQARLSSMAADQNSNQIGVVATTAAALKLDQDRVKALVDQRDAAAQVAAVTAKQKFAESQTAEYGFKKFWEDYKNNATSNAKDVEDIMKRTTDSMSSSFASFTTTGKLNFKSMVASISADAAKALGNKAIASLLGMAVNYITGSFGGGGSFGSNGSISGGSIGSAGGSSIGDIISSGGAVLSAKGNVVTPYGALPLNRYEKGGIAHMPQVSIMGEGSLPEANIPLDDGRSVPVTLKGGTGGGDTNVSMNVNIQSNGQSSTETDGSGAKAAQLSKMLKDAALQVINEQKRPGGLLYV